MLYRLLAIISACALAASGSSQQQPEWKGKNLQYSPKDISRDALTQRMREFSFALSGPLSVWPLRGRRGFVRRRRFRLERQNGQE